jgi:hypothetical protein
MRLTFFGQDDQCKTGFLVFRFFTGTRCGGGKSWHALQEGVYSTLNNPGLIGQRIMDTSHILLLPYSVII